MAKKLRVDQSTISNWENGVNPPLSKYRPMLAKLYGCTVDELVGE